ncbi:hypothetical protein D3C85_1091620 [compost metagenome]
MQQGIGGDGEGFTAGRLARQPAFDGLVAPGLVRHATQDQPRFMYDGPGHLERRGHRDQCKGIGRAIADLQVMTVLGETGSGQFNGRDQLIVGQLVVTFRSLAGQTVKIGKFDAARTATTLHMDHRLQRSQGHAHVRWMRGDTLRTGAKDGVDSIQTVPSRATAAGLTFIARHAGVIKIITTGALQQIAASACHIAQLRRGARQDGLGQQRVTLLDQGVPGQVGVADQGADHQSTLGRFVDFTQGQASDIDQAKRDLRDARHPAPNPACCSGKGS